MILAQENSHAIFIDLLINIVLFEKIVELKKAVKIFDASLSASAFYQ
jgi:hypothetical protein